MRRRKKAAKARAGQARTAPAAQNGQASSAGALAAQARQLSRTFDSIRTAHRGEFPAAQRPVAVPQPVNERAIRARHRKAALAGLALSNRAERAAAKERAKAPAAREIADEHERQAAQRDDAQAQLDERWARLGGNDPEVVLGAVNQSLGDNQAPAAAVGVRGDEVELVVLVPGPGAVPDQIPVTPAGKMLLRKLTAAERAGFYRELVSGRLLATLRKTFAVAPGLASARAAVVRSSGPDSYGRPTVDCLMAGRFSRAAFEGVRWSEADGSRIVADTSTELLTIPKGASKELQPINLKERPGLAAMVAKADLAALTSGDRARRSSALHAAWPPSAAAWPRAGPTWPGLGRAREVGVEWFGERSRAQQGVLLAVVALLLLGVIGALAGTDKPTTIDTAGRTSSEAAPPPTTSAVIRSTSTTTSVVRTTVVTPARIAEGVPTGGDDTTVERIIDGDTLVVAGGTRIRLIGIDTPETVEPGTPVQCFGPEATRYASELMPVGTRVRLIYDLERLDRYGRILAYVYKLDDGLFVNRAIARNGFAQQLTVPPNVAHAEEFRVAVAEAREANLGLWRGCQATTLPTVTAAPTTRATAPPVVTAAPTTVSSVAPPGPTAGCHSSYEGACVPTGFSDVDCAGGSGNGPGYVSTKNFRVVGTDVYGLDADNDGIACESR